MDTLTICSFITGTGCALGAGILAYHDKTHEYKRNVKYSYIKDPLNNSDNHIVLWDNYIKSYNKYRFVPFPIDIIYKKFVVDKNFDKIHKNSKKVIDEIILEQDYKEK
jgi:hypothetical protein